MPILSGPIAPLAPSTSGPAPTMLSRMSVPMPSGATIISKAISSAPATTSLLPQPTGVNPSTLKPQSSYDSTATTMAPKVAVTLGPSAPSGSIFGRGGAEAAPSSAPSSPSSPSPGASSWTGGSPSGLPTTSNALIPQPPSGQAPDPQSAAMMTTPSGGGGGGGSPPSSPSSDKASAQGPAAPPGGIPTIAIVGGGLAVLAVGAYFIFGRKR